MAGFQKLLKGALTKLAQMQDEMRALGKPAGETIDLMAQAESRFSDPELKALKLYHGSPHTFDKFDFENNLKKGEGALAYGPGGYLTGHEPLARVYARNLASRGSQQFSATHRQLAEAYTKDPEALTEYLRAMNFRKITDIMGPDPVTRRDVLTPLHKYELQMGEHVRVPVGPQSYRLTEQTTRWKDRERYEQLLHDVLGSEDKNIPTRIGRGGIEQNEALRIGRELRHAGRVEDINPRLVLGPRKHIRTYVPDEDPEDFSKSAMPYHLWGSEAMMFNEKAGRVPPNVIRRNLNNTTRALIGEPGPLPYKASMQRSLDLSKPLPPPAARNLYETELPLGPEDLLPFDYPARVASPKVLGALSQLKQHVPGIETVAADVGGLTGEALVAALRKTKLSSAEQMRLLRESGLPGMYYLRGGRRGQNAIPDKFNPDDYNFVMFDDTLLPPPKRTEFAAGGKV